MQQVIQISLSGHPTKFNLDADAYDELRQYLDRARIGLKADPDHEEVMRDLEQSIGERLADLLPADEHIINLTDMTEVLAAVGPVDTGHEELIIAKGIPRGGRRRLVRIQEGQDIFGVCQGLAVYAHMDVDWVRTIFFMLALVTGGVVGLVYLAMAFILPVVPTLDEYIALETA
ncbi:MAG: PspC domain-containing protein [Anaerolineae bacterium]|nr:PspC domain-containing protein [Promineifilum sp.]MCW5848246.1 PspC domain-containing protein [Anaerolineae bacterium]